MEIKDLEKRLFELEVSTEVAKRLSDKAIDMAMDALIKVEAMKQSTHKMEIITPNPGAEDFIKEMKDALKDEESEAVPQLKVSPFQMFGPTTRQSEDVPSKVLEDAIKDEELDPFWEEGEVV